MNTYEFERTFVKVIAELAARKGLNDAQLARRAWPHQKNAATSWRKMRNDEEKPKRLNLEEACLLVQALGFSMSDVCGMVQGRMLEQEPVQHPVKKEVPPQTPQTSDRGAA